LGLKYADTVTEILKLCRVTDIRAPIQNLGAGIIFLILAHPVYKM